MKHIAVVLFFAFSALLAYPAVSDEAMHCAECGMVADPASRFTSRIMQNDNILSFCDIGDLLVHLNREKPQPARSEVKDYASGEWIDARKAFYVHAEKKFKSPMAWSIAAFKERNSAAGYGAAMDFEAALKAVK